MLSINLREQPLPEEQPRGPALVRVTPHGGRESRRQGPTQSAFLGLFSKFLEGGRRGRAGPGPAARGQGCEAAGAEPPPPTPPPPPAVAIKGPRKAGGTFCKQLSEVW